MYNISDLQAYDVPSLHKLLRSKVSLLLLSILHSQIILGVETFGFGLRQQEEHTVMTDKYI